MRVGGGARFEAILIGSTLFYSERMMKGGGAREGEGEGFEASAYKFFDVVIKRK